MLKIMTKKKYQALINKIECLSNEKEEITNSLMVDNQDWELRIEHIRTMLYEIMQFSKHKVGKDELFKRVKGIINYIERGSCNCGGYKK